MLGADCSDEGGVTDSESPPEAEFGGVDVAGFGDAKAADLFSSAPDIDGAGLMGDESDPTRVFEFACSLTLVSATGVSADCGPLESLTVAASFKVPLPDARLVASLLLSRFLFLPPRRPRREPLRP